MFDPTRERTVTENIVKDIQSPRVEEVSQTARSERPDSAVGPSMAMLLNPAPEVATSEHVLPKAPIESNDAEELKRKREENEEAVPNEVSKKLKNEINEEPIGGSSLLKEEVPAYKAQVSNTKNDFFDTELTGEAHQNSSKPIHEPTAALYIKDLMRPISAAEFEIYLESKAGEQPESVFLDSIKSHAFVTFPTTEAAQKARTALHGAKWPEEPIRKELWVDFIPVEAAKEFTQREKEASKGVKFSINYVKEDDKTIAKLEQIGGPLEQDEAKPIKRTIKLDDLFHKTTTKPVLYYLPSKDTNAS